MLNERMQRFRETDPYLIIRELERDGAEHVYRLEIRGQPPLYLGTIVGDVLHNLRSALDSIVWDLSADAIPTLTENERQRISFPIADRDEYLDRTRFAYVSPEAAKTEIEHSQPYGEWDPEWGPPAHHPLWRLREWSNLDKHRFVHAVPSLVYGATWIYPEELEFEQAQHPFGPFEDGAELTRFIFREPHPEVDMSFHPMIDICLGQSTRAASADLGEICDHVERSVLPRFTRFFRRLAV